MLFFVLFQCNVFIYVLQFYDRVVCVLAQVDKDIRHPLLLEHPSLHADISSWHTDFELQEIFRKGTALFQHGCVDNQE